MIANASAWLVLLVVLCIIPSAVMGIWVSMLLNRIRKESSKSFEVASRIEEDWQKFSAREAEERQRLAERYERFEASTRDRVDRFEKVASGTRERLVKLEQYLKEFFEVELKSVFDSFDKTVSNILEEMKAELLRGLERIEDIQAFVDTKSFAQDRILDGEGSVYKLLADTTPKEDSESGVAAVEESEPLVRYADDEQNAKRSEKPYRLEADEAE